MEELGRRKCFSLLDISFDVFCLSGFDAFGSIVNRSLIQATPPSRSTALKDASQKVIGVLRFKPEAGG